jgi:hypothetical protein
MFRSREIVQKPFKTRQGTKIAKKVLFIDKQRTDRQIYMKFLPKP